MSKIIFETTAVTEVQLVLRKLSKAHVLDLFPNKWNWQLPDCNRHINPFDTLAYPYRVRAVFCNLDTHCRNLKENSNNYYFMPTNKFFYYINLT